MVSEMVALRCDSLAERALVPAFVYLFALLYPFAWVNDRRRATAAAAGGTVLIRRRALDRIGGIAAIRGALIDDVALAAAVKPGGPIWLGHTRLARSIRPYPAFADIWRMVARSAYVQLRHSPLLLAADHAGAGAGFPGAAGGRRCSRRGWRAPARAAAWIDHGGQFRADPAPVRPVAGMGACAAGHRFVLHGRDDRLGAWTTIAAAAWCGSTAPIPGSTAMSDAPRRCRKLVRQGPRRREFPGRLGADQRPAAPAHPRLLCLRPQRRRHRRQPGADGGRQGGAAGRDGGRAARPPRRRQPERRCVCAPASPRPASPRSTRRTAGGLPPRRDQAALRQLGRADGLLPLLRHAGRPARARPARRGRATPGRRRTRCARRCRC